MSKKYTFKMLTVLVGSAFFLSISYAKNQPIAPEQATPKQIQSLQIGKKSMIVTNNPLASNAAEHILKIGGNAIDAAIAAGFVLGLTEPQSSGIGGGGYALTYQKGKLLTYDGREVAPHSVNSDWFFDKNKNLMSFDQTMLSAHSIGVPSEVKLFYVMHQKQGKLPWAKLLQPAITLANNGFPLSPRLQALLTFDQKKLTTNLKVKEIYFNSDDTVKSVGSLIKNPEYANTLRAVAKNPNVFYTGKIAKDIMNAINAKAGKKLYNQGDLKNYQVLTALPVCSSYRDKYKICSVPPSSSGGVTLLELMGIYATNYQQNNFNDPQWIYNFLEASKLAYADRNQYLADPKFVKQPVNGLLDKGYIAKRSRLVSKVPLATPVLAGIPKGADLYYAPDLSPKEHGTTSLAIIDKYGTAISMTVTVEHQFGSHLFVDGFFLNNELTDFSFETSNQRGQLIANRIEPGKRPRSSIAPTMVFNRSGQLQVIAGSPGGSQIICYVAKNLIQMLDMNKTALEASSSPNLCAVNTTPVIEANMNDYDKHSITLNQQGESIIRSDLVSGETNILRTNEGWSGAADPRREGVAIGGN